MTTDSLGVCNHPYDKLRWETPLGGHCDQCNQPFHGNAVVAIGAFQALLQEKDTDIDTLRAALTKSCAERDTARAANREVRAVLKATKMEGPIGAAERVMNEALRRRNRVDRAFLRVRRLLKRMGTIISVRRMALERALIYLSSLELHLPPGLIDQVSDALYVADDRGNNGIDPYPNLRGAEDAAKTGNACSCDCHANAPVWPGPCCSACALPAGT